MAASIEQLLMQNIFKNLYRQGRIDEAGYHVACKKIFHRTPEKTEDSSKRESELVNQQ